MERISGFQLGANTATEPRHQSGGGVLLMVESERALALLGLSGLTATPDAENLASIGRRDWCSSAVAACRRPVVRRRLAQWRLRARGQVFGVCGGPPAGIEGPLNADVVRSAER
jgi:hypothetical protein